MRIRTLRGTPVSFPIRPYPPASHPCADLYWYIQTALPLFHPSSNTFLSRSLSLFLSSPTHPYVSSVSLFWNPQSPSSISGAATVRTRRSSDHLIFSRPLPFSHTHPYASSVFSFLQTLSGHPRWRCGVAGSLHGAAVNCRCLFPIPVPNSSSYYRHPGRPLAPYFALPSKVNNVCFREGRIYCIALQLSYSHCHKYGEIAWY
jgi:hypothetical protein